jgi:hypothetical protein
MQWVLHADANGLVESPSTPVLVGRHRPIKPPHDAGFLVLHTLIVKRICAVTCAFVGSCSKRWCLLREYSKQYQNSWLFHRGFADFSTSGGSAFCTDSAQSGKYRIYFYRSYIQVFLVCFMRASVPGCKPIHKRHHLVWMDFSTHEQSITSKKNRTTHFHYRDLVGVHARPTKYTRYGELVSM